MSSTSDTSDMGAGVVVLVVVVDDVVTVVVDVDAGVVVVAVEVAVVVVVIVTVVDVMVVVVIVSGVEVVIVVVSGAAVVVSVVVLVAFPVLVVDLVVVCGFNALWQLRRRCQVGLYSPVLAASHSGVRTGIGSPVFTHVGHADTAMLSTASVISCMFFAAVHVKKGTIP